MELLSPFTRHDRFILKPTKITCTTIFNERESFVTRYYSKMISQLEQNDLKVERKVEIMKEVRQLKKSSFNLSKQSQEQIKQSIQSLYYLSPKRKQYVSQNKTIPNFKSSFITLTLPSAQVHSDTEIKKVLNNFLSTLRFHGLKNYVWKLELQKNGNVHFHLIIDKFFHFYYLRALWNKNLNKLGYIDRFQAKFSSMSFNEYVENHRMNEQLNKVKDPASLEVLKQRYDQGVKEKWKSPNTVDVRNVNSSKQLISYLAKYVQKSIKESEKESSITELNELERERLGSIGKCWGRSESLSRLKYKNAFDSELIEEVKMLTKSYPDSFHICVFDYCSIIYLREKNMPDKLKRFFVKLLRCNAKLYNYPFEQINLN